MDARSPEMIPLYRNSKGSWRPDFLIEYSQSGDEYRICEINARFLFNGYLHTAFGQQAHIHVDRQTDPLTQPVVNPQAVSDESARRGLKVLIGERSSRVCCHCSILLCHFIC